jgi:hypothetical protein
MRIQTSHIPVTPQKTAMFLDWMGVRGKGQYLLMQPISTFSSIGNTYANG